MKQKTFEEIRDESSLFENKKVRLDYFLPDNSIYWAHLPPKGSSKREETLAEHLDLVMTYFLRLVKENGLDSIVDKLIEDIVLEENIEKSEKIKVLFFDAVLYHDFGKVNHLFQENRMKNFDQYIKKIKHEFEHQHSALGAYLFVVHHLNDEGDDLLDYITLCLAYPIIKHHARILNYLYDDFSLWKNADSFFEYLDHFNFQLPEKDELSFIQEEILRKASYLKDNKDVWKKLFNDNTFPLFALLKLNFSLLTASDYLATSEYMNEVPLKSLGLIDSDLRKRVFENIKIKKSYNKDTYDIFDKKVIQKEATKSGEALNNLRQNMAIEVISNVRKNANKNLFYIEAPTGGGKTNLSMIACAELLNLDERLNKVFYVFPFTTLITQTHKAIIETLGLSEDEVVQLHSKAGFQTKNNAEEEKQDGKYGGEKQNYIDNLFVNYPFCLLTHIKFFDILKSNQKETNYLLHRLANSIVIIDELQSYNPTHWDKMIYFIDNYAKYFNIKFVLMSATLPKIGELNVIKDYKPDFVYLLDNVKDKYFNSPYFAGRVNFNFLLLEKYKKIELPVLASEVVEKSREYADKNVLFPNSVFTIIEFIFKKTATKFYDLVDKSAFDEVFVLSGTILEPRRKEIINFLKHKENRIKKILLITTQVVEAGVDIDMDLGFKDTSLIDSDEQLAGRINRNVNKEKCELYLFNFDQQSVIYGNDRRFEQIKKGEITRNDHIEILKNKNFNKLYDLVMADIDTWNGLEMAVGFDNYKSDMQQLDFKEVNKKFRLIDQENLSIYVPLDIPIKVKGQEDDKEDSIFPKNELEFLEKAKIYKSGDDKIDGEKVFDFYCFLIENKNTKEFIKGAVELKTIQGILSKFVFSTFASPKMRLELIQFCRHNLEQYGYLVLRKDVITSEKVISSNKIVYSYHFGINDKAFVDIDNQFL